MIYFASPRLKPPPLVETVNTTSKSDDWQRGLSPFVLGPVHLYDQHFAFNVENAWQFSKVYKEHLSPKGNPNANWYSWASHGWLDKTAHRYPMGKGAAPAYSFWDGEKLSYIEARCRIYAPLYCRAVKNTAAFQKLKDLWNHYDSICLWDFDVYNPNGKSYKDILLDPTRKCGHGFILAMMLENKRVWEDIKIPKELRYKKK